MNRKQITLIPLKDFPIVQTGDNIPDLILSALGKSDEKIIPGDVIVITHSIISVAEWKQYRLKDIRVSDKAVEIAEKIEHSKERVEAALLEASEILREEPILITKTKQGFITDFSGIDESNAPPGTLIALPENPDESAQSISDSLSTSVGFTVPVIITDTQGRPWRKGAVNLAIGVAGMSSFIHNVGKKDLYGYELRGSLVCLADEIASSAELIMGQANEGIPVVIVRGVNFERADGSASEILRADEENLFY